MIRSFILYQNQPTLTILSFCFLATGPNDLAFEPLHDKTKKMACAPSEDRSAWASTQSDQSLRCLHEESFGP